MGGFSLKVKTKQGQHIVSNLNENDTIGNLKSKISELSQISADRLNVLVGFPPKALDLTETAKTILTSGITNGDTLIVDEKQISDEVVERNRLEEDALLAKRLADEENGLSSEGILLKKVVPSDNSCLFTSIGYVLNGKIDTECATFMREIIAQHVENDKESYTEAFLGKPNAEYCDWIKKSDTWGGAIEVSILSSFYGLEIDVVDITNAIINRFGEDKQFGMRVFLLFDGIHYDPLYLESLDGGASRTIFSIDNDGIYKQAEQLALEAKSSRQFTDVNKFTLKCIQCDTFLTGQIEAQQHAKSTGHTNFGEV